MKSVQEFFEEWAPNQVMAKQLPKFDAFRLAEAYADYVSKNAVELLRHTPIDPRHALSLTVDRWMQERDEWLRIVERIR